MDKEFKPSKEQLQNAAGRSIPDIISHNLKILFCGINPGLYSGAVRHHFARPGNKFWKALFKSGFTPKIISPFNERELLKYGFGITNVVSQTSASETTLTKEEIRSGRVVLEKKVLKYKPRVVVVLGIGVFRIGFDMPKAQAGLQDFKIGATQVWILPNPSGLNANYQLDDIVKLLKQLKAAMWQ